MDPDCKAFVAQVEAFLVETAMNESTFGRLAANDHKLLERIRTQGSVTTRTMHKIKRFMASQRAERSKPLPRRKRFAERSGEVA